MQRPCNMPWISSSYAPNISTKDHPGCLQSMSKPQEHKSWKNIFMLRYLKVFIPLAWEPTVQRTTFFRLAPHVTDLLILGSNHRIPLARWWWSDDGRRWVSLFFFTGGVFFMLGSFHSWTSGCCFTVVVNAIWQVIRQVCWPSGITVLTLSSEVNIINILGFLSCMFFRAQKYVFCSL